MLARARSDESEILCCDVIYIDICIVKGGNKTIVKTVE